MALLFPWKMMEFPEPVGAPVHLAATVGTDLTPLLFLIKGEPIWSPLRALREMGDYQSDNPLVLRGGYRVDTPFAPQRETKVRSA